MELVTNKSEYQKLEQDFRNASIFDVVLDDDTLLQTVAVIDDRAIGLIVGGQTGFIEFASVPELKSRRIRESHRLSLLYRLPFIGQRLRNRWAQVIGAVLDGPSWIPKL